MASDDFSTILPYACTFLESTRTSYSGTTLRQLPHWASNGQFRKDTSSSAGKLPAEWDWVDGRNTEHASYIAFISSVGANKRSDPENRPCTFYFCLLPFLSCGRMTPTPRGSLTHFHIFGDEPQKSVFVTDSIIPRTLREIGINCYDYRPLLLLYFADTSHEWCFLSLRRGGRRGGGGWCRGYNHQGTSSLCTSLFIPLFADDCDGDFSPLPLLPLPILRPFERSPRGLW
jgi:hypothetical protein